MYSHVRIPVKFLFFCLCAHWGDSPYLSCCPLSSRQKIMKRQNFRGVIRGEIFQWMTPVSVTTLYSPFQTEWNQPSRSTYSAGGSLLWSLLSRRMTGLCLLRYAEQTQTARCFLWGSQMEMDCLSVSIWLSSDPPDGWQTYTHLSVFRRTDRMPVGVSRHMSTDIRLSIENNGWSDWVRLKSWQPMGLLVWKGPKREISLTL